MFIFGKNNNHLIKNNHKKTFSLPQKIKLFQKQIIKCVCGYDFMIILTKKDTKTYCYYQSAIYSIDIKQNENNKNQKIIDIGTDDGLIMLITEKGQLYGMDFDEDKLINGQIKPKRINLNIKYQNIPLKQIFMTNGQIFIKFTNNLIVYLRRNHWIETKTFSDPELLDISKFKNIININCKHQKFNIFLTDQGNILFSQKTNILNIHKIDILQKVIKFAANHKQIYIINNNGEIIKIKNFEQKSRIKLQKISKMTIKFIDIKVSQQNLYGITQNQQVWVLGKNSNGQLGLSDYQPRATLYPMISLERFFVKNIYLGQQYTCCEIDQNKPRQSNSISQRSNWLSSVRVGQHVILQESIPKQIQNINLMSTIQRVNKIQYNETQSKQSLLDVSLKKQQTKQNIIINKKRQIIKNQLNQNNKNSKICHNKSCNNSLLNNSILSSCKSNYCQCNKNRSISKSKSINNKKQIKPVTKSRSIHQNDASSGRIKKDFSQKGNIKNEKLSIHKYLTPNKTQNIKQSVSNNKSSKPKIQLVYETHRLQVGKLQDKIHALQRQVRLTNEQKRDLFQLVKQKNQIIDDITSKISLLEEAIQQHQKTLSARDYEAQDFYLKEKQYQLHIVNLQNQIQKIMQILNKKQGKSQQKILQTQNYYKQMQKIKFEIKQKIQGQKQYYRQRIKSIQRKFDQQKNIYQIQIRNLQHQVQRYRLKQFQLQNKLSNRNELFFNQNNQSLQSPSFHTLDIKTSLRNRILQDQPQSKINKQSKITLNNYNKNSLIQYPENTNQNIYEQQKYILQQRNKFNQPQSCNKIKHNNNKNICVTQKYQNNQNQVNVNVILQKIQKNKNYISKSANKLVNILENCDF